MQGVPYGSLRSAYTSHSQIPRLLLSGLVHRLFQSQVLYSPPGSRDRHPLLSVSQAASEYCGQHPEDESLGLRLFLTGSTRDRDGRCGICHRGSHIFSHRMSEESGVPYWEADPLLLPVPRLRNCGFFLSGLPIAPWSGEDFVSFGFSFLRIVLNYNGGFFFFRYIFLNCVIIFLRSFAGFFFFRTFCLFGIFGSLLLRNQPQRPRLFRD